MTWYVQVLSQNYGPYSEEQMQSFVSEGRVNTASMITADLTSGFFNADTFEYFHYWNGIHQQIAVGAGAPRAHNVQPTGSMASLTHPTPAPHDYSMPHDYSILEPVPLSGEDISSDRPSNIYMIMAEIKSDRAMSFLQTVQKFGVPQRVSDTVWLLRSAKTADEMRNTLSQTLTNEDRLFILDSTNNKTAWFNIGADLDHRIRELWDEDKD
jgi:hypothetical protein